MVQVLPAVQTFGEKLAPVIGQFGADIGEGLRRRRAQTEWEKLITPRQPPAQPIQNVPQGQTPQAQMQPQSQPGLSPLQEILNQPGGPTLQQTLAISQKAQDAGVDPKVIDNYLSNLQRGNIKEQQQIKAEERAIAKKGNEAFFEQIGTDRVKLGDEERASDMILDAIKSGEIDPFSQAHIGEIARAFGVPEEITKSLETVGSKEFKTARKTFIGNTIKDAFRGTTTKIEINLAEDMLSELGVTKEANLAAAFAIQAGLKIRRERLRLFDELTEEGVSPSKIPATVDKLMKPYIAQEKDYYFEALKSLRAQRKNAKK
jgi:hypothetical protein